ncbi:SDR family oxidoreductase [Rhizorhapis suberifaciens]|uniref:NAD(P)H dehydrogenase (Quinone) n=1 Tax=Rhizorhapis suberifaciens TaxID=13656 RepID=A0A840HSI6_9SPHN|nr:SDR family oxidoreductase [Rhizorhapis suberifaciens]MBB4640540.1 NAD(P)H dehydrogenase (quinone) [Rhizorhapis suberifaciens]
MKIIITGASGQYGRSAVEKLAQRLPVSDLILISRKPERLSHWAERGAQIRYGDFDRPESLPAAFEGGDRMLLISGTRVGKRVAQHKAAIDAAAAAGVKHIVYTSFVGLSDHNPAIIVKDHGPTEELLRASGMAWTALRDAHYADAMIIAMGPNFVRTGQWISSTAGGRETLVWRDDCVECAVAVLAGDGHENRIYNITGSELLTFREIAQMLSEVSGRTVEYVETDDDGMYAMFDAMGIPREPVDDQIVSGISWNSDDMVSFEAAIRGGHLSIISNDVERLTGHKPRSVRQMIEENRALLQAAAHQPASI